MGIHRLQQFIAAGYVGVLAVIVCWAHGYHGDEDRAPAGGVAFARHFICFGLFHGYESGWGQCRYPAQVEVALLRSGDIILGHNPHAVYGHWSHATIAVGDGQVLEQNITQGISIARASDLDHYDELLVLRPRVSEALRQQAARWALSTRGAVFNLAAHPRDLSQWTCAKSVWAAYAQEGVEVGDGRFWMTPDALAAAPSIVIEHRFGVR